ncbi:hypothetical protein LCGC14_1024350 [marine sediment metagenome]|uniref:Methyltransferase domain-containing protein n=1 Tax=marine sediment metagenome TaxID=412755 RepID=A0A0F9MWI2_9ZZZZ
MRSIEETMAQVRRPTGAYGQEIAEEMNKHHEKLSAWGLSHIQIPSDATILDIGCGGGKTLQFFAKNIRKGKIYGIDYSEVSVEVSKKINEKFIQIGLVDVQLGTVSSLPFSDDMFDLITGIETSYFWPDLLNDLMEILRVLKPNGELSIINEAYKIEQNSKHSNLNEKHRNEIKEWVRIGNILIYSPKEYYQFFKDAGYSEIEVYEKKNEVWITIKGKKPKK